MNAAFATSASMSAGTDSPVDISEESGDLRAHVIACRQRWNTLDRNMKSTNTVLKIIAALVAASLLVPRDKLPGFIMGLFGG
jgi:hypothetical protein